MRLQPGDYIEEENGVLKVRLTDPRGIILEFEGTQMDYEKFMDTFEKVEKYMKDRAEAWDKAIEGKPLPDINIKP